MGSNPEPRRGRGQLEASVKYITDAYVTGEYTVPKDAPLTAYRVGQAIRRREGLDRQPSTGAVQWVFDRWQEIGFATFTKKPVAFEDYTEAGRTIGLKALSDIAAEQRRAARNGGDIPLPPGFSETPVVPAAAEQGPEPEQDSGGAAFSQEPEPQPGSDSDGATVDGAPRELVCASEGAFS